MFKLTHFSHTLSYFSHISVCIQREKTAVGVKIHPNCPQPATGLPSVIGSIGITGIFGYTGIFGSIGIIGIHGLDYL